MDNAVLGLIASDNGDDPPAWINSMLEGA